MTPRLQRLHHWDMALCLSCNRWGRLRPLTLLLRAASRLGNGVFWYSLISILPRHYGWLGLQAAVHMLVVGVVGLLLYRWLKTKTLRPRPFAVNCRVTQHTATLDQFSFPSGHTLHAVSFTLIALHYFPALAALLIPFTLLVALSRPVLGLHYPSDVIAGALLGASLAGLSLILLP